MATKSNINQGEKQARCGKLVCCMDCLHSHLIQYGNDPVIADCHQKPQPYNERFPYQREVARHLRQCSQHSHTDKVKDIERRAA